MVLLQPLRLFCSWLADKNAVCVAAALDGWQWHAIEGITSGKEGAVAAAKDGWL